MFHPFSHASGQVGDESYAILNGFGTVVNSLGQRAKPYLPQICGTIKWRLNNKSAKIRQQVRGGWELVCMCVRLGGGCAGEVGCVCGGGR